MNTEDQSGDNQMSQTAVLVTEDDDLLLELISSRLQAEGFRVMEAATVEQALSQLANAVDILVTDIGLPGRLDGWSLARRAHQLHPGILVVYMSSGPLDGARQLHPSVYLHKPFHPDEIINAIRLLTSRKVEQTAAAAVGSISAEIRPQLRDVGSGEQRLRRARGEDATGIDEGGE